MMDLFDDEIKNIDTSVILEQTNEEGSSSLKIPYFNVLSNEDILRSSANLSTSKNLWNEQDEWKDDQKPNLTVMLVDDNMFNIMILQNYVKKLEENFTVFLYKSFNGEEAVKLFNIQNENVTDSNINLIIMDCSMPIMDGYEATRQIKYKVSEEGYQNPIIIGHTAYNGPEEEQKCQECGMDGYLLKPCTEKCFLDLINSYFQ